MKDLKTLLEEQIKGAEIKLKEAEQEYYRLLGVIQGAKGILAEYEKQIQINDEKHIDK